MSGTLPCPASLPRPASLLFVLFGRSWTPRNGYNVTNRPFLSARAEVAADATRRASEKRAAREAREAAAKQRREAFLPGAVFTPEFAANDRVVLRFYGPSFASQHGFSLLFVGVNAAAPLRAC